MNTGQIIKSKIDNQFTFIPNALLRSDKISAKAKGLICFLLSLPTDWVLYKTTLPEYFKDGKDSLNSAWEELEELGYVVSVKVVGTDGRFKGWNYMVYQEPVLPENKPVEVGKTESGNPAIGKSADGQPAATNKDNTTNKEKQQIKENTYAKGFIPPSLSEVEAYFSEKGYSKIAAKKAFDYYEAGNWSDSKGQKVKNWKQKMNGVWFKEENRATVEVATNRTAVGIRPEFGWVMFSDGSYKTVPQKEIEAIQANNELLKNYR